MRSGWPPVAQLSYFLSNRASGSNTQKVDTHTHTRTQAVSLS